MDGRFGCEHLSDAELLSRFEDCRLEPETFHHGDHIRLAWLYVARYGGAHAEERLLAGIRKMAECAGVPQKFMYTTTVAWIRLIAAASEGEETRSFSRWIERHPEFLNKDLLSAYYSPGILESPRARLSWIEPDRKTLT